MLFVVALFFSRQAYAHIVGTQNWCLVFSPFHQECIFETELDCIKNIRQNASLSIANDPRPIPKNFTKFCSPNSTPKTKSFFSPL